MAKIDWRTLTATLTKLTEDEVKSLLDDEVAQYRRPMFVRRLHQRYASLRTMRERKEIMGSIGR